MRSFSGPVPFCQKRTVPMNPRLNVDRFKAARIAQANRVAGTSTLLHDLLERTRGASTLSDLASRWKRSSTSASAFTSGLAPTPGADLSSPDALRDFLDRIGQIGSPRALDGTAVPTREPAALPEGAQFLEKDYSNAAGRRPYKLYVPSCYEGQPLPLVVMLHGCTQSPDDFAAGTRMNALAEEHACLVAYPGKRSLRTRQSAGTGSARRTSAGIKASPHSSPGSRDTL